MMIEKADLGISFDGDGDRIGILSKDKFLVPGDLITAFLSGSILKKIQINLLYWMLNQVT